MTELIFGLGIMLAVGGGFRAVLAVLTARYRDREGQHEAARKATRGAVIYGSATALGIVLIALGAIL